MVRTAALTFLGWAVKAHSYIPRVAPQVAPPKDRDGLPLTHSVCFRNEYKRSYYNMKMIRRGVLTSGQFQSLDVARLMNALPRTWKEVYNHGAGLWNRVPSREGFDTPTLHVQKWTRAWLLQLYAFQHGVCDPQSREVWEEWANAQLPPRVKDFAQRVVWHKLTVHARVYKRSGMDKCPICAQKESIKHTMVECSMFKAATAVIQHYCGPMATRDAEFSVRDMIESDNHACLLSTDQGRAIWSATSAHWRYICKVNAGASLVFTSYLTTWLDELCGWIEYYRGEQKEQWRGFKQSLE